MDDNEIRLVFSVKDVIKEAGLIGKELTREQAKEFIGWMINRCDYMGFYEQLQEYIGCYFSMDK